MKFTLKDYQEEAVSEVLVNLAKARKRWHEDGDKHAFSLTATTGAGKTVMAAAVFEALFFGDDEFEYEPDPGAVVIWFSDDPSLNEQSRWRLNEASDKLTVASLKNIDNDFSGEKFEAGKIYFLNTQKLSKNSLLVRGSDPDDSMIEKDSQQYRIMPDLRSHSIWDTIQNTIEDPELTLYLVLDEAHRGMRESTKSNGDGRPTIVKQLINGKSGVSGIPVVWGISATVERFNEAISGMQGRATLPNVVVDSAKVQDSGLIKDTINLDVPDEAGDFSTVLLRRGTEKLIEISEAWENYASHQADSELVSPLMVLQVPNSPNPAEIGVWLDTVFEQWPELTRESVANVFGEHRTEEFGSYRVPYIAPERVQESNWVRILVAKDAISTGWDCPRAEVMVSLRAAADKTHITQLLGRMVRTPLARRIPGNERLNSVDCLLPNFNKNTVEAVVTTLMTGGDATEALLARRVLVNPREMNPNPEVPEEVWEKLLSLPSQSLPKRQVRPIKRLTSLAHELAADGLLPNAGKEAHGKLHKVLDGARVTYADEVTQAREAVLTVEGKTVTTDVATSAMSFNDFVEESDFVVIEEAYKRAGRSFSPDLVRTYSEHLATQYSDFGDPEEALVEAHTVIAALGLVPAIKDYLEAEADKMCNEWLENYRVAIKRLSDERQDIYRQIREMSADPLEIDLARPSMWLQPVTARESEGRETNLPRYEKHLLCDEDGLFPEDFNDWERDVLAVELQRKDLIAWYRNPARASQDSLGIAYENAGETKIVRPDFIFFSRSDDGSIEADIVDPHGHHLADALPKLKGMAAYSEMYLSHFRRVETVARVGDSYKVLDHTEESVRSSIRGASDAQSLYEGDAASVFFTE